MAAIVRSGTDAVATGVTLIGSLVFVAFEALRLNSLVSASFVAVAVVPVVSESSSLVMAVDVTMAGEWYNFNCESPG